MAIGAMNRIQKHGLRVADDISVAGFDDIPLAAHSHPPLTTIRQPIYQIARETCAMLIDLITGQEPHPAQRLMTPELVVRESTASVREQERRERD
jgi:DNA-binding LacI/PurR family transcriptional regulator